MAGILLKVDTRGEKTASLADITTPLERAGIHYRPIYLLDRKETQPVILEIELQLRKMGLKGDDKKSS